MEKKQLKHILTTRLKDIYIQTFNNYCSKTANQKKCKIINTCQQLAYESKAYLTQIRSANIRTMLNRCCIDANCTLDSSYRSFRYKSMEDSLCKTCNVRSLSDEDKLQMVLNFKPLRKKVNENKACEAIYAFVKNTYQSIQGITFSTSVT